MKLSRHTSAIAAVAILLMAGQGQPQTLPAPHLDPFTGLPQPKERPGAAQSANRISSGTPGLTLAVPFPTPGRTTLALLGDLFPAGSDQQSTLKTTVDELNLLRPEAVLTTGNLTPGLTRIGVRYVAETNATRALLDELKMPWLPCAGVMDVVSGTRMPGAVGGAGGDRRFEELYQRYVGPLYFSADIGAADAAGNGGVHAIVLDSEEGVGAGNNISDAQLQWLRQDLSRTFDAGRVEWVIVLLHRPLWRLDSAKPTPANWQKVHSLLLDFNRRPIATVEGLGTGGAAARGPHVAAVFAGGERAYAQDPVRDGIRYYILGPTSAVPHAGETPAEAVRHFTLVKFDNDDMHVALVRLGSVGDTSATVLPEDIVTTKERMTLDAIAAWSPQTIGIDGVVDERGEPLSRRLAFHAENPLADPIDLQLRMSAGSNWDFATPPLQRHLAAGEKTAYEFSLRRIKAGTDRPVVEAMVYWNDARSRRHEILLPRDIAMAPAMEVTVEKAVPLDAVEGWTSAPSGVATAWAPRSDQPRLTDSQIKFRADEERLFVRIRVEDPVKSYWPAMQLDPRWGGIASDAVSVSIARGDAVERLWVLPFAPKGPEFWTNTGIGKKQSPLARLDAKAGAQVVMEKDERGYMLTLSLPRKLLGADAAAQSQPANRPSSAVVNVSVHDNDEGAMTWVKSWADEDAGPQAWARLTFLTPATGETRSEH